MSLKQLSPLSCKSFCQTALAWAMFGVLVAPVSLSAAVNTPSIQITSAQTTPTQTTPKTTPATKAPNQPQNNQSTQGVRTHKDTNKDTHKTIQSLQNAQSTHQNPNARTVVITADNTHKVSTTDEISGASTLVDDHSNNVGLGDIDTGEVSTPPSVQAADDNIIKTIQNAGKIYTTYNLTNYARQVNNATWSPNMRVNSAMTVKLQALLDWNHASPGPIDGGFGMNTKKALTNFQKIKGLPPTGKLDTATWEALTANISSEQPVLVSYTITRADVNNRFTSLPANAEERSRLKGLYYENIQEMLGERFHMDVAYLKKLNPNSQFQAGDVITVINTGEQLNERITHVHASIADKVLYAYHGNKLIAAYPTTIGSTATATPQGKYRVVSRVKMPWYKATVGRDTPEPKTYMLPPGPNSPVGVVWLGLSRPSYGIHGSPVPEGISRQASLGCVRLTNWDVLEVYDNISVGASVEIS